MKKLIYIILSLIIPVALSAPVYADATTAPINYHPGLFIGHRRSGLVSGTTSSNSENWSGYAATGSNGAFSSVTSSWAQPSLSCSASTRASYSANWVGLDGYSDQTVEQIGTEANCSNGNASYSAWYEMYPGNPYEIPLSLSVSAGNQITASVSYAPSTTVTRDYYGRYSHSYNVSNYTLTLSNVTTGKSFSTTISTNQQYNRSSAEVITEAPYSNGILPLSDYVTINYTGSLVNGQPMGAQPNLQDIIMDNPYGMVSTPSAFDSSNEDFSINWSDPT